MRVTPPGLLKMNRDELLRDVRERLALRAPRVADALDRTHPAWMVVEESAFMVEALSEQLDRWPWAVLQQFAHLLGAQVEPATPAVGVVAVTVGQAGRLSLGENPERWRFLTPQSEERGLVDFVPAEPGAPVTPGRVRSVARLARGELQVCPAPAPDAALPDAWRPVGPGARSAAFDRETVRYELVGTDAARLEADVAEALKRLAAERPLGWVGFSARRLDDRSLEVVATIDPALAFAPDAVGGGDVEARWGTLDESSWTPPVRIADHPMLPPRVRGGRPLPSEGALLVADVPANVATADLLVREARPAPPDVPLALWRTLTHLVADLAPLRPRITRALAPRPEEPAWLDGAVRSGAWFAVATGPDQVLVHVELPVATEARPARFAVVGEVGVVRVFAVHAEHGVLPDPLVAARAFALALPGPDGRSRAVVAHAVEVPAGVEGLVLALGGAPEGVMLNPLLVVNAPVVRDGRAVLVSRAVPEPVSLLHRDVVTREVVERLVGSGLDPGAGALLSVLPLARVRVGDPGAAGRVLEDFDGLAVDAAEGLLTLHAPDARGQTEELRRGEEVTLDWYRRTQAALGNVGAGEIRLVEQAPSARPRVTGVTNPLPTGWGADRERDEDAVARIFGPQTGVPVTPGDWERLVRAALGRRGADWLVRVWGYSERALVSAALWPPREGLVADPGREALQRAVDRAGPEVLLVAVGPRSGSATEADTEFARRTVDALVARWAERVPTVRAAIVAPLHPLRVVGRAPGPLPRYALADVSGMLEDARGRRGAVPAASLLLNAAIVDVVSA